MLEQDFNQKSINGNRIMKKTIMIVVAISLLAIATLVYLFYVTKVSIVNTKHIAIEGMDETIYFMHNVKGLNYKEIIISTRPIGRFTFARDNRIVYSWDEKLFYKQFNDTLIIYCSNIATIPEGFQTNVKIRQIQYDIHKFNWLLANHRKDGFAVFPAENN